MKTIEINTDNLRDKKEIYDLIAEQNPERGDNVIISASKEPMVAFDSLISLILLSILEVMMSEDEFNAMLKEHLFGSSESLEKLELEIEEKCGINVTVDRKEDEEREYWYKLGAEHFASAYGEDEPDYSEMDIKEPNPEYKDMEGGQIILTTLPQDQHQKRRPALIVCQLPG